MLIDVLNLGISVGCRRQRELLGVKIDRRNVLHGYRGSWTLTITAANLEQKVLRVLRRPEVVPFGQTKTEVPCMPGSTIDGGHRTLYESVCALDYHQLERSRQETVDYLHRQGIIQSDTASDDAFVHRNILRHKSWRQCPETKSRT